MPSGEGGLFFFCRVVVMEIMPSNSIMLITPYFHNGLWVFDDPNAGLVREPFVAGAPEILEALLAHHNIDGRNGFNLLFSATAGRWRRVGVLGMLQLQGQGLALQQQCYQAQWLESYWH